MDRRFSHFFNGLRIRSGVSSPIIIAESESESIRPDGREDVWLG